MQYPAYLLADAGSDAGSAAGQSRITNNEFDGAGLPGDTGSYGTLAYAYDPGEDEGTTGIANNVKVVNNDYEGFDVGVALLA